MCLRGVVASVCGCDGGVCLWRWWCVHACVAMVVVVCFCVCGSGGATVIGAFLPPKKSGTFGIIKRSADL